MGKVLWFAVGAAAGFLVAHQISKTSKGKEFLGEVDRKTKEVLDAVSEGYKAREAEIKDVLAKAQSTLSDAVDN